jgi:hypothetical protein
MPGFISDSPLARELIRVNQAVINCLTWIC